MHASARILRRVEVLAAVGLALGAFAGPVHSRQAADGGGEREEVSFDVVRLYGVEGKTLVEVYSRIPTSVLTFTESGGRHAAELAFALQVKREGEVVLEDAWRRTKTVADAGMLDNERVYFVETHAFLVEPGSYALEARISDAAGTELGRLSRTLEAPVESPPASDLLLLSRIAADTAAAAPAGYDPTRKNQLVLNPNPGQVYSTGGSPLMYFYLEFENRAGEPLGLERVLRFVGGEGGVVRELRSPKTYQPGWTVDFGALNVAGLPAGDYRLELAWEAPAGAELPAAYAGLERAAQFTVVREPAPRLMLAASGEVAGGAAGPAGGGAAAAPVVDYYEGYAAAELDSVFAVLDVFFGAAEKRVYEGLTAEGKRTYLNRFWALRDPTPQTPANEYRDEVAGRLAEIERQFGNNQEPGWRTPRGRIWLKHGRPDRRTERVLEEGFSAPYEIWNYYTTGYKYVFLDEFRNRRYILLTSSDPEEQGRPDWLERLPRGAVEEILRE